MTIEELRPYVGTNCHVRFRCRPCGGRHHFFGRLKHGPHFGEVSLGGHSYSTEDVEAIWTTEPRDGQRRARTLRGMHWLQWRGLLDGGASGR